MAPVLTQKQNSIAFHAHTYARTQMCAEHRSLIASNRMRIPIEAVSMRNPLSFCDNDEGEDDQTN